ncbi:hypothetical protein NLG97_g5968 [Lecanicillium saksenae]|uniref:Uncharacterized protein n=1 Tax=Lecanicillium saksenae TaxID=468837 RepID=A0ACC1QQY9_9HYPO|nr:hypothetical protein NLG97_g5968 [Lecanicillium saksenae]
MASAWFGGLEKAASNGWISALESTGTGKGQGTCLSGLYWDPSHGSIASGVGSGDAPFTSVWVQARSVGGFGTDLIPASFQNSGFRLARMFPNTGISILNVNSTTGAVTLYKNYPGKPDSIPDKVVEVGKIASGIGDGPGVTFVDIDGDGLDDYIWISEDGIVTAYKNGGQGSGDPSSGTWIWIPMGVIASNLGGGARGTIIFGDIDGDGRADYHVVNHATGALTSFLNMGPGRNPTWQPMGQIASGLGGGGQVMLADLNGDGRADYIWIDPAAGVVTAYINTRGLASGLAPVWIPAKMDLTLLGAKFDQITLADLNNDNKADYITRITHGIQVSRSQCSGLAYVTGDGTRFADLNGDGLDDYIWMDMNGAMTLYLNGGWHSSGKQIWLPQGVIATGVGSPRSEIHLADLDGDGLADYLVVDPKSGAVTLWKNGGSAANQANGWLWLPQGKIASGIGAGAGVRFADIDGDGKDDYLWLDENGAVTAYINGGPNASAPGGWVWLPQGVIATGVGAARQDVQFADINGDGKADYLWVGRIDGTVNLWYNGGPGSDKWIWYPAGEVATGTGSNGQSVMFADTTGSGRDDYLVVTPSSGAVSVWLNGCSGGFSGGSAPFSCEQAYDALEMSNESGAWRDMRKREKLTPTSTIDENAVAAHFHARGQRSHVHGHNAEGEVLHMFDERAKDKPIRACGMVCDISQDFPSGGQLNGDDWGWVNPKDCGNFDFGSPLTARAANVEYHTEHILEAQMIDLFFEHLNKKKSGLPDPKPNAQPGKGISFCEYVDDLWEVPPFVWPGQDTTGGVGKAWNPIMHIAAQYPTKTFKRSEFVALESAINTPSKTRAWASDDPWDSRSWTKDLSDYAKAKVILQKMRSTMGSRLYQSHSTISKTMKTQTERIGKVLDALDSTLLPANGRAGFQKWSKQNLESEWLGYMKGQYTTMQSKTNGLVNDFLPKMKAAWVTQAEKDKWKDAAGDTPAQLAEKKDHRNFIKSIEDFETKWNGLPAWTNPL